VIDNFCVMSSFTDSQLMDLVQKVEMLTRAIHQMHSNQKKMDRDRVVFYNLCMDIWNEMNSQNNDESYQDSSDLTADLMK
jgi:hypothetical protein